jgi:hypothetical protein
MKIIGHTSDGDYIAILTPEEMETGRYKEDSYENGFDQPRLVEFRRRFIEAIGHYNSSLLNRAVNSVMFRTNLYFPKDDGTAMTFDEWASDVVAGRWTGSDIFMFGEGQRKALRDALAAYLESN